MDGFFDKLRQNASKKVDKVDYEAQLMPLTNALYPELIRIVDEVIANHDAENALAVLPQIAQMQAVLILGLSSAWLGGFYDGTGLLMDDNDFDCADFFKDNLSQSLEAAPKIADALLQVIRAKESVG